MDEDFESFVVTNPDIVDPSIDVSGLKTTTDANILGNITDFPGIQYEAYNPSRLSDLMRLYSSGLPTLATDTAQIPGAIDTLVDAGGDGGMDLVTGDSMLDAPTDGLTQSGTFGGQPTFTTTPGTTVDDVTGDITNPDGSFGGNIVDEFATPPSGITGDSIEMENLSPIDIGTPDDYDDLDDYNRALAAANVSTTISGAPVVSPVLTNQGPITIEGSLIPGDIPGVNPVDEVALTGTGTPEQQGLIDQAFSKVGSTASDIMNDLSQIPGAIADFANQTVDIAGKKINVGGTLLKAGINRIVGGPISLVFDAIGALASQLPPGISETTKKARTIGLIQGDNTVTQDKYGINTQSAFGDYDQYAIDKEQELQEKFDDGTLQQYDEDGNLTYQGQKHADYGEYNTISGVGGDINLEGTGDASVAEQVAQKEQQEAFADIQNQIGQSLHGGDDPAPAPAPAAPTNVGNPFGYGGGGGRDSGGDGGGGGSPGSAGPGGSDAMGSF